MNKALISIIALLILLLPSQILMIKMPIYPSHDGLIHIERIKQFHEAVISGQIPPRIAPTFAGGIGFPIFVVNYQLPYYLAEILMLISKDPIVAFKSVVAGSYLLSAVFAFFLFRNYGSHLASLVGALIFSYVPYRFANIYTRAAFGESVAIMFVPLLLLSLHQISKRKEGGVILLAIATFGLITSHTVIFFLFLPFFIAYSLMFTRLNKKILTNIFWGVIFSLFLSAFQLLPVIFEKHYTRLEASFLSLYTGHFLGIYQLLRIPTAGMVTGSPFQIGLISSLIIGLSFLALFFKKNYQIIFFLTVIILSIFATQNSSLWFWQHLPFLKYLIFPWRFLTVIALASAFLSVILTNQVKFKKILACFLIILALYTARHYFLKPTQFQSTQPTEVPSFPSEYDTIWSSANTFKERSLVETDSSAQILNLNQEGVNISFDLLTDSSTKVTVRRIYFPGWTVQINGIDNKPYQSDGLVSFKTEPGNWQIKVYFGQTLIRQWANLISLSAWIILLATLSLKFIKKQQSLFEKLPRLS